MILLILLSLFLVATMFFVWRNWHYRSKAMKQLAPILANPGTQWTPAFLEEKRKHTDPVADKVVQDIMEKGELDEVNHLFSYFKSDADSIPSEAPAALKEYFATTAVLPSWANQDLIDLGQQIYIRHGVWVSLLLSYKSLPECYACAKGAEVLFHTARLNEHHGSFDTFSRRIAETAQFVMLAMLPGGLDSSGKGIRTTQKVRLIHAIIRYYLRKQNWDNQAFDEPINQQDMAGTLMSFSALILEGMEQIGIQLDPVEREAYIHCWRVVGHIVGLDDDLIPANSADALRLGHAILDNQIAESEHGKALFKALLEFQNLKSKPLFSEQGNISMMRLMMGERISQLLGVPAAQPGKVDKLLRKLKRITAIGEFLDHSLIFAMVIQFISRIALQFTISKMTKTSIVNFYLPKSLTKDWGVPGNQ